jgi:hypothetical protein
MKGKRWNNNKNCPCLEMVISEGAKIIKETNQGEKRQK